MWQARKGTGTPFRADRRWIAAKSAVGSLVVDLSLNLVQENIYLRLKQSEIASSLSLLADSCSCSYYYHYLILALQSSFIVPGNENLFSLYLSIKPNIFYAIENQPSANFLFSCFARRSLKSFPFFTLTLQTNYLQKSLNIHTTKFLFQKEAVSSRLINLIEEFLVKCSVSSEFTSITEFTTEILNLLTSSIPVWKPLTPYGGVFFTNLTRIYKPLIDLG